MLLLMSVTCCSTPEYNAAQLALLLQQTNQVDSYTIACYVASGDCRTSQALEHRYTVKLIAALSPVTCHDTCHVLLHMSHVIVASTTRSTYSATVP